MNDGRLLQGTRSAEDRRERGYQKGVSDISVKSSGFNGGTFSDNALLEKCFQALNIVANNILSLLMLVYFANGHCSGWAKIE